MARWTERKRKPRRQDRTLSVLHEAGHAMAAHALGRHVVYIRTTPVRLPVGHPGNPSDRRVTSDGLVLTEPQLGDEINEQQLAGRPLTEEQVDWLLQEAVIVLAGPIAESPATDWPSVLAAAKDDFRHLGQIARALGRYEERNGTVMVEPAFQHAAEHAARTILVAHTRDVLVLAKTLRATPVMREAELSVALAHLDRGSYLALLNPLRA
jgi:hypothetical protein